jgi:hypothetical protein
MDKKEAIKILIDFIECLGLEKTKIICKECESYRNCKVGNVDLALEILKNE